MRYKRVPSACQKHDIRQVTNSTESTTIRNYRRKWGNSIRSNRNTSSTQISCYSFLLLSSSCACSSTSLHPSDSGYDNNDTVEAAHACLLFCAFRPTPPERMLGGVRTSSLHRNTPCSACRWLAGTCTIEKAQAKNDRHPSSEP